MFELIEADATEFPGGVVAESVRDKAVGRLVEGDGDDEGDDPDRDVVEGDVQLEGPPGSKDEGKASTDRPSEGVKAPVSGSPFPDIETTKRSSWIASRSLSSGAHSRDPLAANDGEGH